MAILPDGQIMPDLGQSDVQKIFPLQRRANQRFNSARLPRSEGRSRSSRRAVRCGGREAATDERSFLHTVKSFGSDAPVLASSQQRRKLKLTMVARKPVTRTKSYKP